MRQALTRWDHSKLSYTEVAETLAGLSVGMSKDNDLAKDLWAYLDGEARSGVSKQSLTTILMAIMGSKVQPTQASRSYFADSREAAAAKPLSPPPVPSPAAKNRIGRYNAQGEYTLSEPETQLLRRKYAQRISSHLLFSSRRNSSPNSNSDISESESTPASNFTFRPHISSRSSALASAARLKVVYNATIEDPRVVAAKARKKGGNLSVSDLSVLHMSISEG